MPLLSPSLLFSLAALLLAMALAVIGISAWQHLSRSARNRKRIDRVLDARQAPPGRAMAEEPSEVAPAQRAMEVADAMGRRLGGGRYADAFIATEDRRLIELCGFQDLQRARSRFVFARAIAMMILPLALLFAMHGHALMGSALLTTVCSVFLGVALGYMMPKWILQRRAKRRKAAAAVELPLLVDLLRLLQGVGLSIDQSMQVLVTEFAAVMPVLGYEFRLASDLYARGRTREQSLQRVMTGFDNDDLTAISRLIVQVDKHGGAVQEPLARFGERLRESRRLELKERVGKLTVKMTGVMVVTLMPALLIITAGGGFLAIIRSLSRMSGI